jgi:spectinomycin phosphotransferase
VLEKPAIQDETISACIQAEFDLHITQITFLPLGGDLNTAVYRSVASDGTAYFCKLRHGRFDEISVEVPKFLSEQGISQIISPFVTNRGQLWAELDEFNLILYPFVEGTSGFELELSEHQWWQYATALEQIHTTVVPLALSQKIRKDRYTPEWRDTCRNILKRLDSESSDDPITVALIAYLLPKRETILAQLGHAERFANALASQEMDLVLCHSDIHPGNLFIDTKGDLFIVDWDDPMLAPKERDLMFVGGGQGFVGRTAQEEEKLFYRNYKLSPVNPIAMAYYRCERNIVDFSVESTRILSSTLGDRDRAQSLEILTWLFGPNGSIDMADKSVNLTQ